MGFSFLLDILPQTEPWKLNNLAFVPDHIFYQNLRHPQEINLTRIGHAINNVGDDFWNDLTEQIPSEWIDQNMDKIKNHLFAVRNNLNNFLDEVRRLLI